jgi:uncharacterized protein YajQ (UPF0234 family)
MAAPNIVNVTAIYGKTSVSNVTTTPSDIVTNSAASGKVFKINSLVVANIDGTTSADITASVYRSNVEYKLANTISVPADAALVVVSKDTSVYLEEGDSIRLTASANGDLQAVCSYEEIN